MIRAFAILIALLLAPALTFGQNKSGEVIYEETMDFGIEKRMERMKERMQDVAGFEEIMERVKKMQHSKKVLYFTEKETMYRSG